MMRRLWRRVTTEGLFDASVLLAIALILLWQLHPAMLFSGTLLTGGDTGSHLVLASYLHQHGSLFNLTPWYPGWFDGMPAYTYYFVLPDLVASFLTYIVGFAIAFKLATVLGTFLLPLSAYVMARLMRAPRPIPLGLALATLPFLFDASFTIDGGNLFSTMAGEYAFSLSLSLALIAIGLFARGMETGKRYWLAALALAATLMAHLLPWFFAVASIVLLAFLTTIARRRAHRGDRARPLRFALGAGLLSIGLGAWWLAPFSVDQSYANSMGYVNDPVNSWHAIFSTLGWFNATGGPAGDRWVIVMAAIAVIVGLVSRTKIGIYLSLATIGSFVAYVACPQGVLWNERLVPFWFLLIHLSAGWLVGYVAWKWMESRKRKDQLLQLLGEFDEDFAPLVATRHRSTALAASIVVALLGVASTLPGLVTPWATGLGLSTSGNQVANWSSWNYSGYQAKPAWPELQNLMATMRHVGRRDGCGRAMWEYNASENRFGTPEALMLMPYFTNNCIDSMEGLFFESSATTPYHFLNQAELSVGPSDPQVGLPYGAVDVALGVKHLQMLGVKYFVAFSPSVIAQANRDASLVEVAHTRVWSTPGVQWVVYEVRNAGLVVPLQTDPVVIPHLSSRVSWLNANVAWYLEPSRWHQLLAESGPASWPRSRTSWRLPVGHVLARIRVSNVQTTLSSISFHVSHVGVPVEVKTSYFPNWHARGALGPYRVSPNLMVVVPTSRSVQLTYGSTPMDNLGTGITSVTVLVGAIVLISRNGRQRRR